MRLAWATDIHLNFARPVPYLAFVESLHANQPHALLITGDIAEAPDFDLYLKRLAETLRLPIYFVLGNHDFYRSSVTEVRQRAAALPGDLHWLPARGIVELTPETALIGHDGFADARCGDYTNSDVMLNDFHYIAELIGLGRHDRRLRLQELAEESAAHFRRWLPEALARYPHVIVATHVPPYREATWHDGQISGDHWLPFFSSRIAGEAINETAAQFPHRRITVLCGHTHGAGVAQPAANVTVVTGGAVYGAPAMQASLELN
jgi:3',5'-cyclic-AMP phosphodiesterase